MLCGSLKIFYHFLIVNLDTKAFSITPAEKKVPLSMIRLYKVIREAFKFLHSLYLSRPRHFFGPWGEVLGVSVGIKVLGGGSSTQTGTETTDGVEE
jgi:hypothetical protein